MNGRNELDRRPCPGALWAMGLSLATLPLLARASRVYNAMPQLPERRVDGPLPSLSIIVPARNEADNLRRLLPSLVQQDYPGDIEIIVVDDQSTDGTAAVVQHEACRSARDIQLLCAGELPTGWLGKPHASHTGAQAARGQWLLFTDADTEHRTRSAASAVAYARSHGLDGLSVFPQQETQGLLESAVLMVAFAGLFAGLPRGANILNGQYVLIRRDVYEASGGFAAVRAEMMEDLAYGALLARQGSCTPVMRGESVASVHMYSNWRQMWRGFNRLGSGSLRHNRWTALLPVLLVTGTMMPAWTALFYRRHITELPSLRLVWLATMVGFVPWARRFSRGDATRGRLTTVLRAFLAPAAAAFVQLSAAWGLLSRMLGRGLSWKDRQI